MKRLILSMIVAVATVGGACGEEPGTPLRDSLPATWELEQELFQPNPRTDAWWDSFGDPTLTMLISQAVDNNFSALGALKRIEAARQASLITAAGYYPNIGISAGYSLDRAATAIDGAHSHGPTTSYFSLGLSMNWEIDVFGRISAKLKADKAAYEATEAEYEATLVSLCGNLAKAYFQLRMAQEEIEVAKRNIANAETLQHIAETRYEVGLAPSVDAIQARMVVTQTRSTLPQLEANITSALNELSILCGVYPDKLASLLTPTPLPETPEAQFCGDPRSLLRRRPDIVEAEKQLAQAAAQVGISKKEFLPTLSLQAAVGVQAHSMKDLFSDASIYYQVMPTLSWTIFDGMARRAGVAQAKAEMEAEIDSYNLTVMTAVQEVNNALAQWKCVSEVDIYNSMLLKDAKRELELQTDRYRQGLCDFSDVADAETTVLQYEDATVQSHAERLAALVTIYTALGGGDVSEE